MELQAATPLVEEFSTSTVCPSRSDSRSASRRPTKSGLPPAGVPVTIRTVRAGQGWAASGAKAPVPTRRANTGAATSTRRIAIAAARVPFGASKSFGRLGRVPEPVHLRQRRVARRLALRRQCALDRSEAPLKFPVRGAQNGFRIGVEMPGQIDYREQQISDLGGGRVLASGPQLRFDLVSLLPDLGQNRVRIV